MSHWKNFNHRNLWQHPLWAKFQESIGRKIWYFEVDGAMALVVRHPLPLGLCWLEIPRGPLFEDEKSLNLILQKIKALAQKEKAIFARLSSYKELTAYRLALTAALVDHHPQTSLILDLTLSEDQILAQMKPKGRYNIKVAQKNGVSVEELKNVEDFYSILKQTGNRDGFGIHSQRYYQKMLDSLGSQAQLLVAKQEDKVIAGGIFVYLDEWGIYYYGASDHAYRKSMAPYLIQWEAIKEAKKRGCKFYDFLGIAPEDGKNHAWAGVTDFKKKFGGQVVNYPQAQDLVIRPFWYWLYKLRKKIK